MPAGTFGRYDAPRGRRESGTPQRTNDGPPTTDAFIVGGKTHPELVGRLVATALLRKLFDQGTLACHSNDGLTARNGTICAECRHPKCRPWIRLSLEAEDDIYLVDLGATSARNLLAVTDQIENAGLALQECLVRLTITSRGHWGEVRFERLF